MTAIGWLKWQSAVDECRIHASRLCIALARVACKIPLEGAGIERLADEDTAWLDQFLYRFSKLQDAMGERLFVDGLLLLGEDYRDKPFIDALDRLETLALIPSSVWWRELRELRNQIAHEYPERRDEQASAINAIVEKSPELTRTFDEFVRAVEVKKR